MNGETAAGPLRKSTRAPALRPLTTFRFFAAAAIVIFHAVQDERYSYLASGVSFFFILSGFILTYVHPRLDGFAASARFWISRLARIWPLHLFTLALVMILQPFGAMPYKHFFPEFFLNVFLLQCWIPVRRIAMSFNFVAWSISVETFFYLVFPLLLPWVFRAPVRMILASVACYLALVAGAILVGIPDTATPNTVSFQAFLFCPALHLYEFVTGMAVAVWWMAAPQRERARGPWSLLEFGVLGGILLAIPWLHALVGFLLSGHTAYSLDLQVGGFVRAPLFALLIYVFAFQAGALSSFFSQAWLVYLGDISFTTYMIHCILLIYLNKWDTALSGPMQAAAIIVSVLGASAAIYGLLEKPARALLITNASRLLHLDRAR